MKLRRRYGSSISFNDLLFNTLLGFVFLFICAFLLIAPITKKAIETKAEFVITVTWNNESADDVDVWLEDPAGNVLFFRQRDIGLMHLDRDDLGKMNDKVLLPNGESVEYEYNQEIVTIRGILSGEWVLNVHMYRKRDGFSDGASPEEEYLSTAKPTTVVVKMDKLNPELKTIVYKKIKLVANWQEETVARFTMAADGSIMDMNELPKSLIQSEPRVSDTGAADQGEF
jgi:hypothetical protein